MPRHRQLAGGAGSRLPSEGLVPVSRALISSKAAMPATYSPTSAMAAPAGAGARLNVGPPACVAPAPLSSSAEAHGSARHRAANRRELASGASPLGCGSKFEHEALFGAIGAPSLLPSGSSDAAARFLSYGSLVECNPKKTDAWTHTQRVWGLCEPNTVARSVDLAILTAVVMLQHAAPANCAHGAAGLSEGFMTKFT